MKTQPANIVQSPVLLKIALVCLAAAISENSFSRTELSFCPFGGPPGWMNYFDYKRDQNIWRQQNYYPYNNRHSFYHEYRRFFSGEPSYHRPYPLSPFPQASNPIEK